MQKALTFDCSSNFLEVSQATFIQVFILYNVYGTQPEQAKWSDQVLGNRQVCLFTGYLWKLCSDKDKVKFK